MNLSGFLVVFLSLLPWVAWGEEMKPRLVIDKKSCGTFHKSPVYTKQSTD